MTRLLAAMKTDVTVQVRNKLYAVGIGVGILVALIMSQLFNLEQLYEAAPVLLLLVVGGSTLLYVAGMIVFEKDEGTLNAVIVSPLRTSEYLWSKILTLTALATLESLVMVGGAALILSFSAELTLPNIPVLLLGIIAMGVMYTLIGIIMIVRYDKITDFLVAVIVVAGVAQLPFLHFLGLVASSLFLLIPTSAPTLLMRGAFFPLETGEWLYAIGYTGLMLAGLMIWAYRAFNTHIVMKGG
jgi:fluoroquinolone transport system permease protein